MEKRVWNLIIRIERIRRKIMVKRKRVWIIRIKKMWIGFCGIKNGDRKIMVRVRKGKRSSCL